MKFVNRTDCIDQKFIHMLGEFKGQLIYEDENLKTF